MCIIARPAPASRTTSNMEESRSEEHTSELQSQSNLVCRLLLEKKKKRQLLARHVVNLKFETQLHVLLQLHHNPQNVLLIDAASAEFDYYGHTVRLERLVLSVQ